MPLIGNRLRMEYQWGNHLRRGRLNTLIFYSYFLLPRSPKQWRIDISVTKFSFSFALISNLLMVGCTFISTFFLFLTSLLYWSLFNLYWSLFNLWFRYPRLHILDYFFSFFSLPFPSWLNFKAKVLISRILEYRLILGSSSTLYDWCLGWRGRECYLLYLIPSPVLTRGLVFFREHMEKYLRSCEPGLVKTGISEGESQPF